VLPPVPLFSVDVEDWFQVNALEPHVPRHDWDRCESRVVPNTHRLLAQLARHGRRATCFVLGWVAERHPALVRALAANGHEVASHGYAHRRIPTQTPAAFRADVVRAKAVLEDALGAPVLGYRAPSFSLTAEVPWAAEILVETGHRYDSSRFPIRRTGYGDAGAPRRPHWLATPSGALLELPPAVWEVAGVRVPVAGGGWFRQLPLAVTRRGLAAVLAEGLPAMFYLHPWELDPGQPQLPVPWFTRVRHYRGLAETAGRLERLLQQFPFTSVASILLPQDLPDGGLPVPAPGVAA
jgi:polysaccharide deacetylase family protein (PEP-CTERM system associated)